MTKINELVNELVDIALNPVASIQMAMRSTGKKAVGCFPIYAPEEVVYAAGLLPVGMWGGQEKGNKADTYLQSFCCSIMRANTEQALNGRYDFLSAVIVTAYCDTLKCIMENWKIASPQLNIIPIIYPQNRKIPAGKEYMISELNKLKSELEKITKNKITEEMISQSVDLYDEYRITMQQFVKVITAYPTIFHAKTRHLVLKAAYFMDKKEYTKKIREIISELEKMPKEKVERKRIILSGVLSEPNEMLDVFTDNNMQVVADDLAQESRQFRVIAPKLGTGFERMAERIAMQDGCSFLYDEFKTRGRMLLDIVKETNADAVVYLQMKFCDPEELDYPILKKEFEAAGVRLQYLEIEQQMDSWEQIRTRIQSFSEMMG